jgi:hypothetical protein
MRGISARGVFLVAVAVAARAEIVARVKIDPVEPLVDCVNERLGVVGLVLLLMRIVGFGRYSGRSCLIPRFSGSSSSSGGSSGGSSGSGSSSGGSLCMPASAASAKAAKAPLLLFTGIPRAATTGDPVPRGCTALRGRRGQADRAQCKPDVGRRWEQREGRHHSRWCRATCEQPGVVIVTVVVVVVTVGWTVGTAVVSPTRGLAGGAIDDTNTEEKKKYEIEIHKSKIHHLKKNTKQKQTQKTKKQIYI